MQQTSNEMRIHHHHHHHHHRKVYYRPNQDNENVLGSVSSSLCVCENWKGICSQTQLCPLRCLMTIIDNYMFRPLLAIVRILRSLEDNLQMASKGRNM